MMIGSIDNSYTCQFGSVNNDEITMNVFLSDDGKTDVRFPELYLVPHYLSYYVSFTYA